MCLDGVCGEPLGVGVRALPVDRREALGQRREQRLRPRLQQPAAVQRLVGAVEPPAQLGGERGGHGGVVQAGRQLVEDDRALVDRDAGLPRRRLQQPYAVDTVQQVAEQPVVVVAHVVLAVQDGQLRAGHGGGELAQAEVGALHTGALLQVQFAGRRPVAPVAARIGPQLLEHRRERVVVGDHGPALTAGEDLAVLEAEAAEPAERAGLAALPGGAVGLRAVLHDGDAARPGDRVECRHVGHVGGPVHGDHRARVHRQVEVVRPDAAGVPVDVDEHRDQAGAQRGGRGGGPGQRRYEHRLAVAEAE